MASSPGPHDVGELRRRLEQLGDERDLLRLAIDGSSDLVVLTGADGHPRFANAAARSLLGYEPDELLGLDPVELIHPDDRDAILHRLSALDSESEIHGPAQVRVQHRDGSWRWLEVLTTNLLDDPSVGMIVTNSRDITARVEAEQQLRLETERYRVLVESIPDMVARFDRDLVVRYLNPAAERILEARDGLGSMSWPDDSAEQVEKHLRAIFESGRGRTYENLVLRGGRPRWYEVAAVPELGPDDSVEFVTTIAHDVTTRKETERELTRQVLEDPLTGLANRVWFERELTRSLDEIQRSPSTVAVLFLDLDRFKEINDRHGHAKGDDYLQAVARQLTAAARSTDLVSRFGGDEFAVRADHLGSRGDALVLAERIHEYLDEIVQESDDGEPVGSASIGVAYADADHPLSVEELLRCADEAMYQAKRDGRRRTAVY